jgi:cryptochrome
VNCAAELIVRANMGITPVTYQKFQTLASSLGPPPKPVASLTSKNLPTACHVQDKADLKCSDFDPPPLKELGIKSESDLEECLYPGGETEGLQRLDKFICDSNGKWVRGFEKPLTSPNSLEPSTTVLSPYVRFGCVSSREMYWRLVSINSKGKHSNPPVSLVGQLLWREFFYTCGATVNNFDRMKGNPICKQGRDSPIFENYF